MLNYFFENNNIYITNIKNFTLESTLDCGQAFRWSTDDGMHWHGIANGRYLSLYKQTNDTLVLENVSVEEFEKIWRKYFDLDRNYEEIISHISSNKILKTAAEYGCGIRLLNQDPWETLCSFIISQNNNIPRIKGIIDRLCTNFGDKCSGGYTFPSYKKLAGLEIDDLAVLRSGFRAKYILDAANKLNSGEIDLEALKTIPTDEARTQLMKIKGVGPKVADCVLLFSLGHIDAFPKDVWIKRAIEVLFNGDLPEKALPYAGIVQQYIFYYARETKLEI
ncbi:MAG: DNA glycosylase [Clostridia bacterium]|nr:DNA glycosylase [Clostridia bacterium]